MLLNHDEIAKARNIFGNMQIDMKDLEYTFKLFQEVHVYTLKPGGQKVQGYTFEPAGPSIHI